MKVTIPQEMMDKFAQHDLRLTGYALLFFWIPDGSGGTRAIGDRDEEKFTGFANTPPVFIRLMYAVYHKPEHGFGRDVEVDCWRYWRYSVSKNRLYWDRDVDRASYEKELPISDIEHNLALELLKVVI